MSKIILLDSGPLGMISNPKSNSCQDCKQWFNDLLSRGQDIILPEIADYEVRRELIRAGKTAGIKRLDRLKSLMIYCPITTETMLLAAELWAQARKAGTPTADPKALDGDVILAAQAKLLETKEIQVTIATTNVGHLSQFVDAREWQQIN
jgi:predicted nucleic acid-binding protein